MSLQGPVTWTGFATLVRRSRRTPTPWNGAQLVPADWVELSTSAITPLTERNPESRRGGSVGFGMMWWVWDGPAAAGAFEGAFTGAGAYGQFITVLPALDMVVAHKTAVGEGHGFGRRTLFSEYRGILERLAEAAVVPAG